MKACMKWNGEECMPSYEFPKYSSLRIIADCTDKSAPTSSTYHYKYLVHITDSDY